MANSNLNKAKEAKKDEFYTQLEADHINPWKEGGTTVAENCQMLCRDCNRKKGSK